MQEKNIVMNKYWSDNEQFADIMNVAMFHKSGLLTAEQLKEADGYENVREDTYEAIGVLTHSEQFLELKEKSKNEKGGCNMCKAFEDMEKRGEKRGKRLAEARFMKLIQIMTENGELEDIPKLATDRAFYEEMIRKCELA